MKTANDALEFSTILASSAHDMKNSLAILLTSLSEISNRCHSPDCPSKDLLIRAQQEGERVSRDLVQLLTLYRIEQSSYFVNLSEIVLSEFLDDIVAEYQSGLASHNIDLQVENEATDSGYFDEELISGIINTVISNAHRYTKDSILLQAYNEGSYLVLSIKDNGPGYPDALLQSDSQMQEGINFGTGSTGLGLYFASRVAALHKNKGKLGYIRISNNGINGGGCFSIYLP